MTGKIAVIGAGIAGVTAARRLADAGHDVTLFDKSRGVGGRMATRRVEQFSFDHGAQFFTARAEQFQIVCDGWRHSKVARIWYDDRLVGAPGMTAPVRHLAEGLALSASHTVNRLVRQGQSWALEFAEKPVVAEEILFDRILLAIPAPQAALLLASAGLSWPAVNNAVYAPCWALLIAPGEDVLSGLPDQWQGDDPPIAWIARNSGKPGRAGEPACYVVHATPQWSRDNLEISADAACDRLIGELARLAHVVIDKPHYAQAHRWRYALVEQSAGEECLWDADLQIGACGDWCIGGRVDAAFLSGLALAERVMG